MKLLQQTILISFLVMVIHGTAQTSPSDSTQVVKTLKELLNICKIDYADPNTGTAGKNAAQYIVYRGENKSRKWKEFADYSKNEDKQGVDQICLRINSSINLDKNYEIIQYLSETESEGKWHIIIISYNQNGTKKQAAFAFLKIIGRFALGDIDE